MANEKPFRLDGRTLASLRVRIAPDSETGGKGGWGVIRDLSTRGAFLKCDLPLKPGDRLRLLLEEGEQSLEMEAEVKWTTAEAASEPGAGIAFIDPSHAVRRRIHELESQGEIPVLELHGEPEQENP